MTDATTTESEAAEMAETKKVHKILPIIHVIVHEDHTIYILEIKVKEEYIVQKGNWETVFVHVRPNPKFETGPEDGLEVMYTFSRVDRNSLCFPMTSSDLAADGNEALWEAVNYCYHN